MERWANRGAAVVRKRVSAVCNRTVWPDIEKSADRIRKSAIKKELVAALDDWYQITQKSDSDLHNIGSGTKELLEIACRADPDTWRDRLRDVVERSDDASLARLAAGDEVLTQPVPTILLLTRSMRQLLDPNSKRAIEILRQAQMQHPADFWINVELANLLPDDALAEEIGFRRIAAALRPDSPLAFLYLGIRLFEQRSYGEAESAFRTVMCLQQDLPTAEDYLTKALIEQKKFAEAETLNREAVCAKPTSAPAHDSLANVLLHERKYTEAKAEYDAAIRIAPNNPEVHMQLGGFFRDRHEYVKAETEFREAIHLNPDSYWDHNALCLVLKDQNKYPDAENECRECIRLNSKIISGYSNLGFVLWREKKYAEAEIPLQEALRMDPTIGPRERLCRVLVAEKKYRELEIVARDGIQLDSKQRPPHRYLAEALIGQAETGESTPWSEAAEEFARAIKLSGDRPTTDTRRLTCREVAEYGDELFSRVVKLLPEESALWIGRGQACAATRATG